ncbi:MAG: isoprenyl transferase [Syntrophales bacterium]|jgi:undecaprenyl diphosphate synthase|nr:isoprenyl transferase [Syntrophales bacterium]
MSSIDSGKLPQHIAIIMDGNGRWAKSHALGRVLGHRKGAESVRVAVKTCRRIGIKFLTLYAFSMENWFRPQEEVSALMKLLEEYLEGEAEEMMEQDIRLMAIGRIDSLDKGVLEKLRETMEKTAGNGGMVLNLALSYGGREEIAMAARRMLNEGLAGKFRPEEVTEQLFQRYLYTSELPDPDLLIRTGGEHRISNFLLFQAAYTEFYFSNVLWPDFREPELLEAIAEFQKRERRFGRISEQLEKR